MGEENLGLLDEQPELSSTCFQCTMNVSEYSTYVWKEMCIILFEDISIYRYIYAYDICIHTEALLYVL